MPAGGGRICEVRDRKGKECWIQLVIWNEDPRIVFHFFIFSSFFDFFQFVSIFSIFHFFCFFQKKFFCVFFQIF